MKVLKYLFNYIIIISKKQEKFSFDLMINIYL